MARRRWTTRRHPLAVVSLALALAVGEQPPVSQQPGWLLSAELLPSLSSMDSIGRLADTIAAHLNLKLEERQDVLEIADAQERLEHIVAVGIDQVEDW